MHTGSENQAATVPGMAVGISELEDLVLFLRALNLDLFDFDGGVGFFDFVLGCNAKAVRFIAIPGGYHVDSL